MTCKWVLEAIGFLNTFASYTCQHTIKICDNNIIAKQLSYEKTTCVDVLFVFRQCL